MAARIASLTVFVVGLSTTLDARAQDASGKIVISDAPEAVVQVDGSVRGTTDASGRLEITGIPTGEHYVVAERAGHTVQGTLLIVEANHEALWAADPFVPKSGGQRPGEKNLGGVVLQTTGGEEGKMVVIDAPSLGWSKLEKAPLRALLASELLPKSHELHLCSGERCVDATLTIHATRYESVRIDLDTGKVEETGGDTNIRISRLRDECTGGQFSSCAALCGYETALGMMIYGFPGGQRSACTLPTPVAQVPTLEQKKASCIASVGTTGFLTIGANRPAFIYVNGQRRGETPVAKMPVPAGCVEVRVVATDGSGEKTFELQTEANKVAIYKVSI